ncbi:MAG TPA: hypothetical protein VKY90_05040 [Candidatus Dormibacteraeota bacterium]|nr:hypothetical protein [Candidatus Dormibacteraeota bacterium]
MGASAVVNPDLTGYGRDLVALVTFAATSVGLGTAALARSWGRA